MTHFEIENTLKTITILVDTREKPTEEYQRRLRDMECDYKTEALPYGDYSCKVSLPNEETLDFSRKVVVERKQNFDEIIQNFLDQDSIQMNADGIKTNRFQREFLRASTDGCRVYLLIENASWENALNGKYRSRLHKNAFTAFLLAWMVRYRLIPIFCKAETTGKLIKEILYREVKEYLQNMEEGEPIGENYAISGGSGIHTERIGSISSKIQG